MNRAERRRAKREQEKAKTATYNLTQEQLEAAVRRRVDEEAEAIRREAATETLVLLLTLPMKVLMDHYWKKTYARRLPEFASLVVEYYGKWQDGELDLAELRKELWEQGGLRIEESKG